MRKSRLWQANSGYCADRMTSDPVFEVREVAVRFGGARGLAGVDFVVEPGERVAIIGPSGAGKTSLIRLLNGTLAPTSGRVIALGCDYRASSARRVRVVQRQIGTIHQQFDLVTQLRAVHNVNAGRLGSWPFWKAALSLIRPLELPTARAALSRVGIEDKLHERTADLSGGEQQRVAIARVLVQQAKVILADEPIASLDPARGEEVIDLLLDISVETGATLVASLHDVDLAVGKFDRIIGLREGRIRIDARASDLRGSEIRGLFQIDQVETP